MSDGYLGTGLWVSVRHRFGPRMPEWFMAAHMSLFGCVLLLPQITFDQPAWASFRLLFPSENLLGWLMLFIGLLRIIGLVINGAREKVTPQIRQFSAGVGCILWAGITFGFYSSDVISTWIAIYPPFVAIELINIARAARDEGEIRNGQAR